MRLGATIFLTDQTIGPAQLARELEERGFSSLWVPEHTHIPTSRRTPAPMGEPLPEKYRRSLDPFVALTAGASVTDTLRLGTGIALLAERDPIVCAKEIASLDWVSNGRFTFGVGYGWNIEELEDHGGSEATRRAVVAERVQAMQRLWADEEAEFHGEHVDFGPSWAWPKPKQQSLGQSGVPVLIGGAAGPKLFSHIAAFADGWIPHGGSGLGETIPRLHQAFEDVGRDPAEATVIPFGTIPDAGKLEYYESLGINETILDLPSAETSVVLETLDTYSEFLNP